MPADIYSLAPINLRVSGAGADVVIPCENHAFSPDILASPFFHSGNTSPTQVLVPGANPKITLSMPFLAAYTVMGLGIIKLTTLDTYLSKYDDFVREGTLKHPALKLNTNAFASAQISGWSVSVDGILMADVVFDLFSINQTHPFTFNEDLTLPTLAAEPQLHTLGPALINDVVVPGLSAHNGQIGATNIVQRTDGDLYPRVAARPQISPSAHLAHQDPVAVLTALGLIGGNVSATTELYFKAYDATTGETRSDGGAIKIAIAKARMNPDGWSAGQGSVATSGINVIGYAADGVANPFIVSTNVTPPATP